MRKNIFITLAISLVAFAACGGPVSDPQVSINTNAANAELIANNELINMKITPEPGDQIAIIETSQGEIHMILYGDKAPETVKNFIEHATAGRYNGVIFHRVIDDFMIQTGDFENNNGTGGYSYLGEGTFLKDEFGEGLAHLRGAVSMANAGPNTGGSQFFIVQAENGTPWLDGAHAIFGYAYEGMDAVDRIATAEAQDTIPVEEIWIKKVTLKEYEGEAPNESSEEESSE